MNIQEDPIKDSKIKINKSKPTPTVTLKNEEQQDEVASDFESEKLSDDSDDKYEIKPWTEEEEKKLNAILQKIKLGGDMNKDARRASMLVNAVVEIESDSDEEPDLVEGFFAVPELNLMKILKS
jgi:hypothetical protein